MHIDFICQSETKNGENEIWEGQIVQLIRYDSHYEMMIESRSYIHVLFGESSFGNFACMPDYQRGCHLADLSDIFWNTEVLTESVGRVDGVTVAKALYTVSDFIQL